MPDEDEKNYAQGYSNNISATTGGYSCITGTHTESTGQDQYPGKEITTH